ncbi:MAG: class I poly(R)-hydroxyalkanoic acid synthase [Altererythrobacter sp.]|nr:class I poly(R)-hydroxyalkanoic acid synthase [Altererythrobacter sp.]|tara:strand:- start:1841 stop:3721 length:1881 start_codon:yes stop_codon:yes gene_type:complete
MTETPDPFTNLYEQPAKLMRALFAPMTGAMDPAAMSGDHPMSSEDMKAWAESTAQLQILWAQFQTEQFSNPKALVPYFDPARWMALASDWYKQMPIAQTEQQQALWNEGMQLWSDVLGQYGFGPKAAEKSAEEIELPRKDRRFSNEKWRAHPSYALIHQTYLFLAERLEQMAESLPDLSPQQRDQLRFTTKAITEAASPANFPLLNPVVMERTLETHGQNLVKGMEHLLADMQRGQLSHTDASAFTLGENIATTPGKVVHETPLYQLIQYTPSTDKVLATPLVIFPPWINRFYILDLNEKKSFVKWAVDQGVTVFMVSWKSADASMKDVIWDDYALAQVDAIDHVRERLDVPSVHTIGYCVAGTTLAATLALLHRRGEADRVKSATFFTAQVDFEKAGELLNFVDEQQLGTVKALSPDGYLDGRYMAATFNLLRGTDLIWNYVVKNYLLGEDYPAFDLLHWNGDVTNLPAKWHQQYLRDLYRDNLLVQADALKIDGTPIDLGLIDTPTYIQAGKEDHIAPAESVWRMTEHFAGPVKFILAGSGHIAGVVNPPSSGKYQYWTNEGNPRTLAEFRETAEEHPGSWWPDWIEWLRSQDDTMAPTTGKRTPGSNGDEVIEDAPGRYVRAR